MESLEEHRHTPLSSEYSTRVLVLTPSRNKDAPIQCRLREVTPSKRETQYEALSYVWGSPEGTLPIVCDGKRLLVTPNCLKALVHLRRRYRERTLWIDAICISQGQDDASTQERNMQVLRMGEIYQASSRVVIWLNLAYTDQERIFGFIRMFKRWDLGFKHTLLSPLTKVFDHQYDRYFQDSQTAIGMRNFLQDPWFFRVWTVQEVAFAQKSVVKSTRGESSWEDVANAIEFGWHTMNWTSNIITPRIIARSLATDDHSGLVELTIYAKRPLLQRQIALLRCLPSLQCRMDHDKVYGLYAVIANGGLNLPKPDYKRPVSELFQELANSFVLSTGSLALLWMTIPSRSTMGLPSWIPDWIPSPPEPSVSNIDTTGTFDLKKTHRLLEQWTAGGVPSITIPKFQAEIRTLGGKLQIPAKHLGKIILRISYISRACAEHVKLKQKAKFDTVCRRWCNSIRLNMSESSGTMIQEMLDCITEILHCEEWQYWAWFHMMLYPNAKRAARKFEDPSVSNFCLERLRSQYQGKTLREIMDDMTTQHSSLHTKAEVGAHYAFITLDSDHHGRAHYSCREGDDVYLVPGVNLPIVLRRQGQGFRVVAPAYIVGAMKGELWPDDDRALETIVLI